MQHFILQRELALPSIESVGYLYEHQKTKARVIFLKNSEQNRVFSITFRTPPEKSNGVAHIIEHSVLNGSRKYPIKDPFIQLNKSSLNTFLNAMTSPDKTMYPVASCNLKDFHNLMDVYLDAVFYPNIYHNSKIFEQEGWHYELLNKEDPITIKGVVYNEMKGAFSTPEQLLNRNIQTALFPNHPYGEDSGGVPEEIPNLSYEEFIGFHKKHYHPSNSYIYFYGNVDMEDELSRLQEYLDAFEYQEPNTDLPKVEPWNEPREHQLFYPVMDDSDLEDKSYFSLNYCLGELSMQDKKLMSILEYILLDAPGALLKEKLLEKNLGEDVYGFYDNGIRDNTFSVTAKNISSDRKDEFYQEVLQTLREIAETGIDSKKVQAAIGVYEFLTREADFGSMPKGIVFLFQVIENWVYDQDPFEFFDYDKWFTWLRSASEKGALEEAILKFLVENKHRVIISMNPSLTLNKEKDEALTEKLAEYKAALSEQELEDLIQHNEELLAYQSEPDSKEDIAKIPTLELSDIVTEKPEIPVVSEYQHGVRLLFNPSNTSGIVYMRAFFESNWVDEYQIPIVSLLCSYLTSVSSEKYHYSELADEINLYTGGISSRLVCYNYKDNSDHFRFGLEIRGKSFANLFSKKLELIVEILKAPKYEELKRLGDLINETASQMQMSLVSGGHMSACTRALSYFSKQAYYDELSSGISFYEFIKHWKNASQEELKDLAYSMKKLLAEMIRNAKITIALTYSHADEDAVKADILSFIKKYQSEGEFIPPQERKVLGNQKEGFITTGNVNYVIQVMNFKRFGYNYHGSFAVANHLLNTEFLWNKVRVEGGAYGGMSAIRRTGDMVLMSYRDPNLAETYRVYQNVPQYFADLNADEEDIKKAIIGTISNLDTPLTPSMENAKVMAMHFSELTHAEETQTRQEILNCSLEDIRKMSKLYEQVLTTDYICTVGSKNSIEKDSDVFAKVKEIK